MIKFFFLSPIVLVCSIACVAQQSALHSVPAENITLNGKLFTALFQQKAADYDALCFQGYNLARLRLDEALRSGTSGKKAIITDIDETVLDNSPYAVHQAMTGKDYETTSWHDWTLLSQADTLAGALPFFQYAATKGVEVFYISNRDEKDREGTLQNLKKYGFPNVDNNHLILKQSESSKESRRQSVAATHEILLLLGDNLSDFSALFDKRAINDRSRVTAENSKEFGKKFIVLPNPGYGDWESALYQYNYKLTPQQKDSIIKSSLKGY
jgi:5'-nucleotidase (lipoprotein e(P4) family)